MKDVAARFIGKIAMGNGGCWTWTGQKTVKGYGLFLVEGKHRRAHRVSWEMWRGAIQAELNVLHRCDNPSCVNPDHLFLGSDKDNIDDAIAKGRWPNGERKALAKLTDDRVRWLRDGRTRGVPVKQMARAIGVCPKTARDAINGVTWGHVR